MTRRCGASIPWARGSLGRSISPPVSCPNTEGSACSASRVRGSPWRTARCCRPTATTASRAAGLQPGGEQLHQPGRRGRGGPQRHRQARGGPRLLGGDRHPGLTEEPSQGGRHGNHLLRAGDRPASGAGRCLSDRAALPGPRERGGDLAAPRPLSARPPGAPAPASGPERLWRGPGPAGLRRPRDPGLSAARSRPRSRPPGASCGCVC